MTRPRDETKVDALLDAALSEVASTGLAGLSIDAVAGRADVAPATLYVYFKGKDALIEALYAKVKLGFSAAVLADDDGPVRIGVEAACTKYLHYCRTHPRELVYLDQMEASPAWKARIRSTTERAMQALVSLLERGKAERIVKDVDTQALIAFLAGALQAAARLSIDDPPDHLAQRTRDIVTLCWDAIRS